MKNGSMIDAAYEILLANGTKMKFTDLWAKVKEKLEILPEEEPERIGRFYTDISLSGKFAVLADNYWDLGDRHEFAEVHADASKFYEPDDNASKDAEDIQEEQEYNEYVGSAEESENRLDDDDEGNGEGDTFDSLRNGSDY